MDQETYRIGAAAAKCGLSVPTVRFYEEEGLIRKPARTLSGQRLYRAEDVKRLQFIAQCRKAGMALPCIERVLACRFDHELGSEELLHNIGLYLKEVQSRREELDRAEAFLKALAADLEQELRLSAQQA